MTNHTQNIMLTGYWPPTNEMIRQFNKKNSSAWKGKDWRGHGYDIYSYFPEFPEGTYPIGVGDFEVDYQKTLSDWKRITSSINPFAIVTFSRGFPGFKWEVESQQRNLEEWKRDYREPRQPIPSPPDSNVPSGTIRRSTLPMNEIVTNVNNADLGLLAYIDNVSFGGGFLSEYIAYLGVSYQALHSRPDDKFRCVAAGHIHVGIDVSIEQGKTASEITLETIIEYIELF